MLTLFLFVKTIEKEFPNVNSLCSTKKWYNGDRVNFLGVFCIVKYRQIGLSSDQALRHPWNFLILAVNIILKKGGQIQHQN